MSVQPDDWTAHSGARVLVLGRSPEVLETVLDELQALGIEAYGSTEPVPRTHMALRVAVDGTPWLADVGFGGCVLTAPLRLDTTEPQPTQHETFRVIPFGDDMLVQAHLGGTWQPLYQLSREPQLDADYEPANWFTSTHPGSRFRRNLMVARATPDARHTLLNARLTTRTPDGRAERSVLDADGIEAALRDTFELPVDPDWRPVIERAAEAGP